MDTNVVAAEKRGCCGTVSIERMPDIARTGRKACTGQCGGRTVQLMRPSVSLVGGERTRPIAQTNQATHKSLSQGAVALRLRSGAVGPAPRSEICEPVQNVGVTGQRPVSQTPHSGARSYCHHCDDWPLLPDFDRYDFARKILDARAKERETGLRNREALLSLMDVRPGADDSSLTTDHRKMMGWLKERTEDYLDRTYPDGGRVHLSFLFLSASAKVQAERATVAQQSGESGSRWRYQLLDGEKGEVTTDSATGDDTTDSEGEEEPSSFCGLGGVPGVVVNYQNLRKEGVVGASFHRRHDKTCEPVYAFWPEDFVATVAEQTAILY